MDNNFTITDIIEKKSNPDYPLLVSFQNGELVPESAKKRRYKIAAEDGVQKKFQIASDSGHTFAGCEDTKAGCRFFCIVKKHGSSEAKMTEIGTITLLNKKLSTSSDAAYGPEAIQARTSALTRAFAGKKQIRRMDQLKKLELDASATEASLNDSIKAIETKIEASPMSVQIEESLLDILPPCNRTASEARLVYNLKEMFGADLVEECVNEMDELLDASPNDFISSFPPFIRRLWDDIVKAKINREERAFAAILVNSLQRFMDTKPRQLRNVLFCPYHPVNSRIMEMFAITTTEGVFRSNRLKDKALCYVLALCFIAGDYTIQLHELASLMNISVKKMSDLCRAVGGTEKTKGPGIYHLKLPLPPIPNLGSQNKRRKIV